jgi:uncharacterized membrane protein YtjA (UPF0391 family)
LARSPLHAAGFWINHPRIDYSPAFQVVGSTDAADAESRHMRRKLNAMWPGWFPARTYVRWAGARNRPRTRAFHGQPMQRCTRTCWHMVTWSSRGLPKSAPTWTPNQPPLAGGPLGRPPRSRNEAYRNPGGGDMLNWALTFLVIALIAGLLGFGGIAASASGIAQVLFTIFLILFVVSLIMHLVRGRAPRV